MLTFDRSLPRCIYVLFLCSLESQSLLIALQEDYKSTCFSNNSDFVEFILFQQIQCTRVY